MTEKNWANHIKEKMGRTVVFTAITNRFDDLKERQNTEGADFVAFLDYKPAETIWRVEKAHSSFDDPNRNAKIHKVLAHKYFPDYDYWLWLDGSLILRVPAKELVKKYLEKADIALFRHFKRTSVAEELQICSDLAKDDPKLMKKQFERYRKEGFPDNLGLWECTALLRRNNKEVRDFNELWWEEIKNGSKRDQLSFPYVVWKTKVKVASFPENVYNNSDYFYYLKHERNG